MNNNQNEKKKDGVGVWRGRGVEEGGRANRYNKMDYVGKKAKTDLYWQKK